MDANANILNIFICAVPARVVSHLIPLFNKLQRQVGDRPVEILVALNNKRRSLGAKHNLLIQGANGQYIAFVDDDDTVSDDYVDSLLAAIGQNPGVDVVTFNVHCNHFGKEGLVEIKFGNLDEEFKPGEITKRAPMSRCAWRAEIVKRHRADENNTWDPDYTWSRPALKEVQTSTHIDRVLYYYTCLPEVSEDENYRTSPERLLIDEK